ncbi:helix-turn-helix transcriptional regulator [Dorea sp. YH-dor226]|uniref:helix-turn-helix domain-containing protein n=1 Tax=Dorea sp. YH-dor226 TaxID=3151119 RepID=UPI0032420380
MQEEIRVAYGKAVRTIRQNKKISQEELADLCGLHRTYISDIELGKRNVSLENIDKIAQALQVKKSELFVEVEHYERI